MSDNKTKMPLPTVSQVVATAQAQGINPTVNTTSVGDPPEPKAATEETIQRNEVPRSVNMNTSRGQVDIPATVGSQPSSNQPLYTQVQDGTKIESFSADDLMLRPLTETEILLHPGIEARNFDYSGDEIKVEPINHTYILRWVQCGDYKGAGTNWLAKQMARGFSYATEEDIQEKYRGKFKKDEQGRFVIPPDLALMKMPSLHYYGYIKGNMIESLDRVSDKGANSRARSKAVQDMAEGGKNIKGNTAPGVKNFNNSLQKDKVSFYDPMAGR